MTARRGARRTPRRGGGREPQDQGAIAVIVALTMSAVLFMSAALAVDLGDAMTRTRRVQDAVDLASLAGAASLPDAAAARIAAVTALCGAVGDDPSIIGWPATTCTDRSWADDSDPGNGEVVVYGPDGNENGFHDDGTAVTLPDATIRPGSTDDERLAPTSSLAGTALRVQPPAAHVTFHFATAAGYSGVDVARDATAGAGTPTGLGTPPLYLLPGEQHGLVCWRLVNGSVDLPGGGDPGHCNAAAAQRGFVAEPRADATQPSGSLSGRAAVPANTARGIDHAFAAWTAFPYPPNHGRLAATPCALQPGQNVAGPGHPVVNCANLSTRNAQNQFRDGFFGTEATSGRLQRSGDCPGAANTSGSAAGYSGFDANDLFQPAFLDPRSSVSPSTLAAYLAQGSTPPPPELVGALSSNLFRCPRLVLLPVLDPPMSGGRPQVQGTRSFPIVALRYVWLGGPASSGNGFLFHDEALQAVQGWVLDPQLFPLTLAGSPGWSPVPTSGLPVQVRLVHDRDDPQPALNP